MSEKPQGIRAKIHKRAEKYSISDTIEREGKVVAGQGGVIVDVGADIASAGIKVGEKIVKEGKKLGKVVAGSAKTKKRSRRKH